MIRLDLTDRDTDTTRALYVATQHVISVERSTLAHQPRGNQGPPHGVCGGWPPAPRRRSVGDTKQAPGRPHQPATSTRREPPMSHVTSAFIADRDGQRLTLTPTQLDRVTQPVRVFYDKGETYLTPTDGEALHELADFSSADDLAPGLYLLVNPTVLCDASECDDCLDDLHPMPADALPALLRARHETITRERFEKTYGRAVRVRVHDPLPDDHHYVWTLLDCDGKKVAVPGRHYVNRVAYLVGARPWTNPNIDVSWKA